jgi:diadenosine tetraphosphatase ApaH/serine/threonine PP2A family protein phosphatase
MASPTQHEAANFVYQMVQGIITHRDKEGKLRSDIHQRNGEDWRDVSKEIKAQRLHNIRNLLHEVKEQFEKESRVVQVSYPAVVFGDIHGNLADLATFERKFSMNHLQKSHRNFVFLGDYVDRGNQSLEVYLLLAALKILNPGRITLLRGNHESAEIHEMFNFKKECQSKLQKDGNEIWSIIVSAMDCMPFSAVIGNSVFCAHGGIPFSTNKIQELNSLPVILDDPEKDAPAAWEVLWNDPCETRDLEKARLTLGKMTLARKKSHKPELKAEDLDNGFMTNTKRGTAYLFSEIAVDNFLKENSLSHIIRAHEVAHNGFKFHFNGKCCTVFSSSFYCGLKNKAGCILVQDGYLIPIQIETPSRQSH